MKLSGRDHGGGRRVGEFTSWLLSRASNSSKAEAHSGPPLTRAAPLTALSSNPYGRYVLKSGHLEFWSATATHVQRRARADSAVT